MGSRSGSPCGWEQRGRTWEGTGNTCNTGGMLQVTGAAASTLSEPCRAALPSNTTPAHLSSLLWHCFLHASGWIILLSCHLEQWQPPCFRLWWLRREAQDNCQAHFDELPGKTQLVARIAQGSQHINSDSTRSFLPEANSLPKTCLAVLSTLLYKRHIAKCVK